MTNEQREAIYRLDKDKDYPLACGDITIVNVADIDTALSLIKEQQEEIERLKTDNGNVWQLNANMSKRHLKDICKLKQKDKQIDLMARAIDNYDSQLEINTFKDKEHIKQYFADLVEKE